jgi:hypothetical protein
LQANLTNHLQGLKHSKALADSLSSSKSSSSALSSGRHGRPSKSNTSVDNQLDLHSWFKRVPPNGEQGEPQGESLMCWGYWGKVCAYNEKVYDAKVLLEDLSPGA